MKIIDSKARLFGKINVFDLILILLFTLIIFTSYSVIFREDKLVFGVDRYEWKILEVMVYDKPNYFYENLEIGDGEEGHSQIINIFVKKFSEEHNQIKVLLKAKLAVRDADLFFRGRKINVGDPFSLKTSKMVFPGTLTKISDLWELEDILGGNIDQKKRVTLIVSTPFDSFYNEVRIGDSLIKNRKIFVEIIDKARLQDNKMEVVVDLILNKDTNNLFTFESQPILVGGSFGFNTDEVYIRGIIKNIEDAPKEKNEV